MFTGLIQDETLIREISDKTESGFKIKVTRPETWKNLVTGESIACDGVCLTLTDFSDNAMTFYVGAETLAKTTFNSLKEDQKLNLERSLALGDRMGGHVVTGHVDGTAQVVAAQKIDSCLEFKLKLSPDQFRFVIPKGSLCVNGVSLTVNEVDRDTKIAGFYLIPETLARTNLSDIKPGDVVNVETDQFVKIIAHQIGNQIGSMPHELNS